MKIKFRKTKPASSYSWSGRGIESGDAAEYEALVDGNHWVSIRRTMGGGYMSTTLWEAKRADGRIIAQEGTLKDLKQVLTEKASRSIDHDAAGIREIQKVIRNRTAE